MKRFVDDDDDEEEEIAPQVEEKPLIQFSRPLPPPSSKARQIHFDVKSFELLASQRSSGNNIVLAKKQGPRIPISNVGSAQDYGVWAPQQEEEEATSEPVLAYKKPAITAALANEPTSDSFVPVSLQVTRHGTNHVDYQGRTFTDARRWPKALTYQAEDEEDDDEGDTSALDVEVQAYLGVGNNNNKRSKRKRHAHSKLPKISASPPEREFLGHTMAVSKVRLHGCLAVTAGMDGTCMIWDTSLSTDMTNAINVGLADERGAIQSYFGHDGQAVKDCAFPVQHAEKFASCGLDGFANLWDTETGQLISRFHDATAVPRVSSINAVAFKPDDEFQLLLACSDRRLRHFDVRVAKPQQTYDFHQSSVNTALFCEHGRKFASTGDDRKLVVWEWGVPSPVKIISEVSLPSMPATALHPSSLAFVAVGFDNRLFQFKINAHSGEVKRAGECAPAGFSVSGSCEPGFSHCGKYLACGDGQGDITIFSTNKLFRGTAGQSSVLHRISPAHAKSTPVSSVQFHPCFDGVLLSVGWDGKLKWWS